MLKNGLNCTIFYNNVLFLLSECSQIPILRQLSLQIVSFYLKIEDKLVVEAG